MSSDAKHSWPCIVPVIFVGSWGKGAQVVNVNVGTLIRQGRQRRGLSLRALARQVGVSASMLSQVETGRTRPSVSTIYAIATELGLSIDALLSDDARLS